MLVLHLGLLVVKRRRSVGVGGATQFAFQGWLRELQGAHSVLLSAIGSGLGCQAASWLGGLGAQRPLVGRLPHCVGKGLEITGQIGGWMGRRQAGGCEPRFASPLLSTCY